MTSNRPYLLRALYEWMIDNALTPHLLVDARAQLVKVPQQYIENDRIVLNITPTAVRDLEIGNEFLTFNARFAGKAQQVVVPIVAVMAVYAKENGEGMVFPEDERATDRQGDTAQGTKTPVGGSARPELKIVK